MNISDRKNVDRELESVIEWIGKAGEALPTFFDEQRGVFWRDSEKKRLSEEGHLKKDDMDSSPTSTLRSFIALLALLRAAGEDREIARRLEKDGKTARSIAKSVATKYLAPILRDLDASLKGSQKRDATVFSDAQLLIATALIPKLEAALDVGDDPSAMPLGYRPRIIAVARVLRKLLKARKGASIEYDFGGAAVQDTHDFISLYVVRGLDSVLFAENKSINRNAGAFNGDDAKGLRDRLRDESLRQLGYRLADIGSRFDPAELVFTITLLNRFSKLDALPLTSAAIDAIGDSQLPSGSWRPARPVVYGKSQKRLHIASFELGLALSYLLSMSSNQPLPYCAKLLDILHKTFGLIKSSYHESSGMRGWCNDHARSETLVESWATAIVLMFLTQYRDALLDLHQTVRLGDYAVERPRFGGGLEAVPAWPDLALTMRRLDVKSEENFRDISDPTDNEKLTKAIRSRILKPIRENWLGLPDTASFILHGPPGTRKSTLVNRLARALGWPLVTITPPTFLRCGLDDFESTAADVFEDLFRFRRVVVFFDECEDFFKRRPTDQKN